MPSSKFNQQISKQTKKQSKKHSSKSKAKQSNTQTEKLNTIATECNQLRAAADIQAEHIRLRGEVLSDQASQITELQAALASEKSLTAAMYARLIIQAEVAVVKDEKIAVLECDVDYWFDEAVSSLELYYSAEAQVVEFTAYIRSDPLTMNVLDGKCDDLLLKQAVEKRLIEASIEGEEWYNKKMERTKRE